MEPLYKDRADIIDVMVRYAWALDLGDYDQLKSVFTDDAVVNIRGLEAEGQNEIIARLRAAILRFARLQHIIGNHLITVDGDVASHRCQMQVQQSAEGVGDRSNYIVGCHTNDTLVRTNDGWRISKLEITETWSEGVFDITLS